VILSAHIRKLGLLSGILVIMLASALPAAASPLSAKKARLQAVQARLSAMGQQVEIAVERYNQAVADLDATRTKIRQNRRLLANAERNAERDLARANRHLAARARGIYMTPEAGFLDVVFASRSFDDLVTQFDVMRRLGDSDVDLIESVTAYQTEIKHRRLELFADEKTAAGLVAKRTSEKAGVLAREVRMREVERGLRGEIRSLLAQQAAAARAAARQASTAEVVAGSAGSGLPPPNPGGAGHPEVVAIAQRYLGIPYVWGGASPAGGFDCSGLTMYVFAQVGVGLAHGATLQQRASTPVPLNALQPGDLVFYGNASFSSHVAINIGGGRTIEAARSGTLVRYGVVGTAWIGGRF